VTGLGRDGTVDSVTENVPGTPDLQRTELLRHGVVVIDAVPGRVTVTGVGADRVRAVAEEWFGPGVEIDVADSVPRRLRPARCLGHLEREARRLQLRYALRRDEHIDDIVVAEDARSVVVFATICTPVGGACGDACDVPHHVYLDGPLAGRTVIDGTRGVEVPYRNVYAELERRGM
jgi:hypothetical protein